jgi:uncharacterized protein (DUF1330 family)
MATLIVTATPVEGQGEAFARYREVVQPLLKGAGGTPMKRLRVTDVVAGNPDIATVLVMDFDNVDLIKDVFASSAYAAAIPDRDAALSNLQILVTEPVG